MIVAWVLFPLLLLAVCLGCGLAVERIAGWHLPGALILSVGLALVVVVATLMTNWSMTAAWTPEVVVVLAGAGYAISWTRLREMRPDPWALSACVGVYVVMAAPIVMSGNATFLGYFVLNDTAVHFTLIDQLLAHGHGATGLPPSVFKAVVQSYISTDYPIGAQVALGAVRPLAGQNVAWIFQPYLAVILSLGAAAIYQLLDGTVESRRLRAACAFVAAQSGLVYAYYLEASIKELATTWVITVTVVLVLLTLRERITLRRIAPLALVTVAAFDVLNLAIAPWVGIPLAVFALGAAWQLRDRLRRLPRRRAALAPVAFATVLAALAVPVIRGAGTFFQVANAVLTSNGDLGNLVAPLVKWQMLGIWPSGDFRFPVVTHYRVTYALLGIAGASAILGFIWAIRRRATAPLLLLAATGVSTAYLLSRASPYASAKVMMIFSLTVVLIEMLGPVALHDAGRKLEAWGLVAVLAGGVLWTNAMGYHGASVAPRARLAELASIGQRFAGEGPTFYNLPDEFAVPLLGPTAPADPAYGPPTPRPGLPARNYTNVRAPWDTDELAESYLQSFHLLVLNRSPLMSRPPADFKLVSEGRYYDVWRRTNEPKVLDHVPLGGELSATSVPSCKSVLALATRAERRQSKIAYATRQESLTIAPTAWPRPNNWGEVSGFPYSLIPRQEPGTVTAAVKLKRAGRYKLWIEGAFSERVQVSIDARPVGSATYQLGSPDQTVPIGETYLKAGSHSVDIEVPMNEPLAPGEALAQQTIGPLTLAPADESEPVRQIDPRDARSLCGRSLDWMEIVR